MATMKRRSVLAGMTALAALPLIKLKQPKAQIFLRSGSVPGPIPPSPAYVTVTRGTSQAVIQVLKPASETQFSTTIIGGGPSYPQPPGPGFDYWINGAQGDWTVGVPTADVISRKLVDATNSQYHIVFQTTPDQAIGDIVTYIEIGALGDAYTPITLAQAMVLAPQLFLWQLGSPPFAQTSLWNKLIPANKTYTTIAWPVAGSPATGGNVYAYDVTWARTGFPVYVNAITDPMVAVTCPATWGWSANPSLRVPVGATGAFPHPPGNDSPIIIIDSATNVAWNFWQFIRTSDTTATAQSQGRANVNTDTGFGDPNGTGAGIAAAGSSELGGLIIQAETDKGVIGHALEMYAANELLNGTFIAPAIATDGPTPGAPLSEGMLLAIPPGPMPTGLSPLGQIVFRALQNYGAYITERGGQGASGFRAQQNAYDSTIMNALSADAPTLVRLLKVVS